MTNNISDGNSIFHTIFKWTNINEAIPEFGEKTYFLLNNGDIVTGIVDVDYEYDSCPIYPTEVIVFYNERYDEMIPVEDVNFWCVFNDSLKEYRC